MRIITAGYLTVALFASLAFGQTPADAGLDRVFYFTHTESPQSLQEIFNVVRAMADAPGTLDRTKKTMSMHGASAQLALSEWLMSEMDKPAVTQSAPPAAHPYRNERGQDEVVRVFSLAHADTPQKLQELTNLLRSTTDMQRVFPYNALQLIVARGSADQIGLADWLVQQLDRPPGPPPQDPGAREIRWANSIVRSVRVFYLTHDQSPQEIQAITNQLRDTTKIQRLIPYNAQRAIAARGTADQIGAASRLVKQLDH